MIYAIGHDGGRVRLFVEASDAAAADNQRQAGEVCIEVPARVMDATIVGIALVTGE